MNEFLFVFLNITGLKIEWLLDEDMHKIWSLCAMTQGKVFILFQTYFAFFNLVDTADCEDVAGAVIAYVQWPSLLVPWSQPELEVLQTYKTWFSHW